MEIVPITSTDNEFTIDHKYATGENILSFEIDPAESLTEEWWEEEEERPSNSTTEGSTSAAKHQSAGPPATASAGGSQQLVSDGISFLSRLTQTLSNPAATEQLVNSLVKKDEKTGETYLKIPVENADIVQNGLKLLGGLLGKLK